MTAPPVEAEDVVVQAASLAFALLRFESGAAHPDRSATPPGMPRLGDEAYAFLPALRRVPREAVTAFLAGLPSPALLVPTTVRGIVALSLLSELAGDRAMGARQVFANQRAVVEAMADHLGLAADAPVLLEFEDEVWVGSLAVLRAWSERFAVQVGWSILPVDGDARASARLMLSRSDGAQAWGASCPVRPPA